MLVIKKIEKVKNILNITTSENKIYKIDFSTGNIIGIKGKILKRNPFIGYTVSDEIKNRRLWQSFFETFCFAIMDEVTVRDRENLIKKSEKYIPYLDFISSPVVRLPNEIPKGYIEFLKNNNLEINQQSFFQFKLFKATKNMSHSMQRKINNLYDIMSSSYSCYLTLDDIKNFILKIATEKDFRIPIFQVLDNSFKNYEFFQNEFNDLIEKIFKYDITHLNINVGIVANLEIYAAIDEEKQCQDIYKNQKKLLPLEQVEHNKYCIVVPKDIKDLEDEGEQQHNCVGYHYNKSIANGQDLIYFIRLKENPKKSFVTCRYEVRTDETAEALEEYNSDITFEMKDFIEDVIDPIIRKILEEK